MAFNQPLNLRNLAELWGFKRGDLAEVLDGRAWVRCTVLCMDASDGDPGAIVRTVDTPHQVLYVRYQQCLRKPEPRDEREAFRKFERERVAAIEARQAAQRGRAVVPVPVIAPGQSAAEWRQDAERAAGAAA